MKGPHMPTVSKGALRTFKQKSQKLAHAVPTLDLRRKQLTREMLAWEERIRELERSRDGLRARMEQCPHAEVRAIVSVARVEGKPVNIAGVMLEEVSRVEFEVKPSSFFATPPSLDIFIKLRKELLEAERRLDVLKRSLGMLLEELSITTQRINLFEKRLIPEFEDQIRYIRGRLEDGERSSVMVAKIAQKEMLTQGHSSETA
jgi:V/A-type H+-transporting ATPase subunit D